MLAPERRTRADIVVAGVIAATLVVAAFVIWARADATGTDSVTAATPAATITAATELPTSLQEKWHAADSSSRRALTSGNVVVTGDSGTVSGRDPVTGNQLWWYRRDMPLCAVESQYGTVIATFRDQRGCSQSVMLEADTGQRRVARTSYMDDEIRVSGDGTYLLALGPQRLEVWRSDLVRTLEYGYVDAPVNPNTQPRKGCELRSAASSSSRLAVLERCPGDATNRLTVLNPAPKESTAPEEHGSRVLTSPGAESGAVRVIAVSDNKIAVYYPPTEPTATEPGLPARLIVHDGTGNELATYPLPGEWDNRATVTRLGSAIYAFTGTSLIALSANTLEPAWTVPGALGTPALMAGRLLVPVATGLAAVDSGNGSTVAQIPVQRTDYQGDTISTAVLGETVFERRGGQLYALD
ncbi:PQQ-binding-like beta-propeller repeat protein [Nocardia lasii]|uniref:PQQ-binding-like beta-propeller repeat protein n=1 Tax=Nocardia lasii TaxID=1616107 RepID=A0ABW1JPB2_9NOCA